MRRDDHFHDKEHASTRTIIRQQEPLRGQAAAYVSAQKEEVSVAFSHAGVESTTHHLAQVEEGVEGQEHVHKPLTHLAVLAADDAKAHRVGVALGLGALRLLALLKGLVPGQVVLDSCRRHVVLALHLGLGV
eukprot:945759-Pleurochrysis_carterae.AAC.3